MRPISMSFGYFFWSMVQVTKKCEIFSINIFILVHLTCPLVDRLERRERTSFQILGNILVLLDRMHDFLQTTKAF